MALITPRVWTRQPDRVVGIDWENPLSRGLVWQGTPVDQGLPFGNRAVITGNFPASVGFAGRAWRGAYQASNNYVRVNRTDILGYTAQVTFEALIFVKAFQTTVSPYISGVISQYQLVGGSSKYGPNLRFNNNGTLANAAVPLFFITQSGGTERQAVGSALTAGRLYHLLGTYNGSVVALYVNGKQVASTNITGAFENDATNFISIGSDYVDQVTPAQNRSLNGDIFLARIYNVGKTAAEAAALAANPWQLFATQELQLGPAYPRIYYVAGPNATWATPTSTEIINGQLAGGSAATASWSESAPLQSTNPFNFSQPASPLTTGTKYRAAAVQKAGDSNVVSNVVVSDPFLAGAATLSNPEATDITSTTTKPKVDVAY